MAAENLMPASGRAVVVSTVFQEAEAARRIGLEAYSYPFAAQAFLPLLRDWGEAVLVNRPESRVDRRGASVPHEPNHIRASPQSRPATLSRPTRWWRNW